MATEPYTLCLRYLDSLGRAVRGPPPRAPSLSRAGEAGVHLQAGGRPRRLGGGVDAGSASARLKLN